jgi:hypothetical protein
VLSRIATRTLRNYVEAALGNREVVPGLIVCVQTFGTVAQWHPHLHVLMTDGGFGREGRFVPLPAPDALVLEELWRRAVLAEFVGRGWLEEAEAMLAWPHSGFGAHVGPPITEREGLLRVARDAARGPVAEARLRYDAGRAEVELVADCVAGPYAGVQRMGALEFLARWVDHVPDHYEVRVRYAGGLCGGECGGGGAAWSWCRRPRVRRDRRSRWASGRRSGRGGDGGRSCCDGYIRWRCARAAEARRGSSGS